MTYEEKIKELDILLEQCNEMQRVINENIIWAANDPTSFNDHAGDLKNTDEKWIQFRDNLFTYLAINPEPEFQSKFENLCSGNITVGYDLLAEIRIIINSIKNNLKIEKYRT